LKEFDPSLSSSSTDQIKLQFRVHKSETNKSTVAVLIKDGENHLEALKQLYETRSRPHRNANYGDRISQESWQGKTEKDGSDERGRVGEMFPWQR